MAAGPVCLETVLCNGRDHKSERPAYRKKQKQTKNNEKKVVTSRGWSRSGASSWLRMRIGQKTLLELTEQQMSSGMVVADVGVFPDSSSPPVIELNIHNLCRVT